MVKGFEHLPFSATEAPIIETGEHLLTECSLYHPARLVPSVDLESPLMLQENGLIMNSSHILEFGNFLKYCQRFRNPKMTSTSTKDLSLLFACHEAVGK